MDPEQFVFHGFGDELELVQNRVRRCCMRTGEPGLQVIEDAIFVPGSACAAVGRNAELGGFLDARGQPLPQAAGRRGLRGPLDVNVRRTIDGAVYLGWLFPHFGHFLLETLSRVWAIRAVDETLPVLFHLPNNRLPGNDLLRFLEAFGVDRERLLVLDEPTRLRRVTFPEPLYELSRWVHEQAARPYRAMARRSSPRGDNPGSGQPLYLSRRLLPSTQREIIGEREFEAVLQENGFVIAHPELLTLDAQVRLLTQHADIFTVDGSAAHSVLFGGERASLHVLADENPRMDHFLVAAAVGRGAFIRCLGDGGRGTPHVGGRYFPHLLEPEPLLGFLETRGLLRIRLRAEAWRKSAAPRSQYSEAWLYARIREAINPARPGAPLSTLEEQEAEDLSLRSWVLNLGLTRYFVRRDQRRAAGLAARFAALVATEADSARLVRYAEDVGRAAHEAAIVAPPVAARLNAALAERFPAGQSGD